MSLTTRITLFILGVCSVIGMLAVGIIGMAIAIPPAVQVFVEAFTK